MTHTQESLILTAQELAQLIHDRHWAIATSENFEIARGDGETYRYSRALLLAAIRAAYPDLSPEAVYEVILDCGEPVAYCANIVRNDPERFTSMIDATTLDMLTGDGEATVTKLYRQVGDGPVMLYRLTDDGRFESAGAVTVADGSVENLAVMAARTMATVTGSVSGTQVVQPSSASDKTIAGQWARA
jgi:hypothetical protein